MSTGQPALNELVQESTSGQCAVVAALVIALHESGALPKNAYGDVLHRLWIGMPEQQAVGEAGAVIERVLDLLDAHASSKARPGNTEHVPAGPAFAGTPVNDDDVAWPNEPLFLPTRRQAR